MTTMIEMDGCRNRWMRLLKRCAVIGDSTINGIFYAPSAPMTLTGNGSGALNTDLVVGSLSVTGNATINEYVPLDGGPFTSATLVE